MFRAWKIKMHNRQAIFYSVMIQRSWTRRMFATSRTQRRGPLLRFRSHFPDIRVPPCHPSSNRPPALSCDPIDRLSSSSSSSDRQAEEDIACPLASEKGLILSIPRARTRQVRVTRLGDNRDDNREHEGEKSPARSRTSLLSRTRRTGCYILEVILWSECAAR